MISLENKYRIVYMGGVLLLFASLFMDWFHFEAFKDGKLIASWSYNIFTEWSSTKINKDFNKEARPNNLEVPIAINILFIVLIFLSIYSVLFRGINKKEDLNQKSKGFGYINILLLLVNGFYIFIFPFSYLMANKLYYPFLIIKDPDTKIIYHYYIGIGYILQVIAFLLIFPYTMFYYEILRKFDMKEYSSQKAVEKYSDYIKEKIDFDELIAEEKIQLEIGEGFTKKDLDPITLIKKKKRAKTKS